MNIFKRINAMRIDFLSSPHKKTGKNQYAGFSYFELADFIPEVMKLCREYGLTGIFRVVDGSAELQIVNADNPEETVTFSAPFGSCNLKGCHEVQNVGSSITYMRRYMWGIALELVENDAIDCGEPVDQAKEAKPEKPYKKAPSIDIEKVKTAMQKAGKVEILDKYMQSVNERGTPEQIEEVTKFYTAYKNAITEVTTKLGKPE